MSFDSKRVPDNKANEPNESSKSLRISSKSDSAKAVIADQFSRGVTRDQVREYDKPYVCKDCEGKCFATSIQLSDHYMQAHGKRMHASMLKPATKHNLGGDSDDD
jgi:hypothetical protein